MSFMRAHVLAATCTASPRTSDRRSAAQLLAESIHQLLEALRAPRPTRSRTRCSSRTLPARSSGSKSSWRLRSAARRRVAARRGARRRVRLGASRRRCRWRGAPRRRCRRAPGRSRRRRRRGRSDRADPGAPRAACPSARADPGSRSPLRSCSPRCIIRRSAALTSPWYSNSSVSSSKSGVGIEVEAASASRPTASR